MSSKNEILSNLRKNISERYEMPDLATLQGITFADPVARFLEVIEAVGGKGVLLQEGQDINQVIREHYPEAKNIASNLPEITIANLNPDSVDDPHELTGIDVGVVQGEVAVAENACVWVPQNVRHKVVYFISEYLVIVIDRKNIVNNMHEAYPKIDFHGREFGVFISGPSKTADIEQALVIGAHGPKGALVVLK